MRPLCALLLVASLATSLQASSLTERIKSIAQRYTASTVANDHDTSYTIFPFQPVRGYRDFLTLREYDNGRKDLWVTIYERLKSGEFQVTTLVDDDADEVLDYAYVVVAPSIDEAYEQLHRDQPSPRPITPADNATYIRMLTPLRTTATH